MRVKMTEKDIEENNAMAEAYLARCRDAQDRYEKAWRGVAEYIAPPRRPWWKRLLGVKHMRGRAARALTPEERFALDHGRFPSATEPSDRGEEEGLIRRPLWKRLLGVK